mgnify:CR=1 FL=1
MANPEHIKILKQGAEVWNEWRSKNPTVEPGFFEADLSGADLFQVDLLRRTSLKRTSIGHPSASQC